MAKKAAAKTEVKKMEPVEITMKVSVKGALSVYYGAKFPVTLYKEQWEAVLDRGDDIREFIKKHDKQLMTKETT